MFTKSFTAAAALALVGSTSFLSLATTRAKADLFCYPWEKNCKADGKIGTSGNDRLSPGGLTTDEYGNAILMGHTDGSFYRSRQYDQESEKTDDLFVMTLATVATTT